MARQDQANDQFSLTSFLYGGNADYIDALYAAYEDDPNSVDPEWQDFFAALKDDAGDVRRNATGASWAKPSWPLQANGELVSALDGNWGLVEKHVEKKVKEKAVVNGTVLSDADVHQATCDSVRAIMMIRAYRMRGHLHANLDPLGIAKPLEDYNELSPANYGFTEADYDRPIFLDNVLGLEFGTIRQMLEILTRTYCSTLGVEFMHISDPEEKAWIQERIEGADKEITFTATGKKAILQKLVEAEGFEQFIDVKYKGTKRFGLDGGEALIPALEQIIKRGGQEGLEEVVLGMAHRGRLNVLTNVMGKPHRAVFHEFKGGSFKPDDVEGSGDVKYHLGASSDREFDGNKVHLSLTANPSHLEIVDPVVMGKARAKQDLLAARSREEIVPLEERAKILPLLIHGDAAFAGQGVIAEMLGLSGLRGHRVAGTLHFIINNQIGFTTNPRFSRSSPYPSDVAKMIEAPIFHVNGDDPEAVVHATKVATEFRMKFHKPVVVDMFCYRRFGHNEGDEPAFTQPIMYRAIRAHQTALQLYSARLISEGLLTQEDIDRMKADWRAHLEAASVYYAEARKFARLCSEQAAKTAYQEYLVVTGGGPGVMEAGNRGAADAGAPSIGLNIVLPHEQAPNPYVTPEFSFNFHYFAIRKMHFMLRAKAITVFPGGFGTLDEMFEALTLIQTGRMAPIPLILFGAEFWHRIINFEALADFGTIAPDDVNLLKFVETADEAWKIISDFYELTA